MRKLVVLLLALGLPLMVLGCGQKEEPATDDGAAATDTNGDAVDGEDVEPEPETDAD